MELLVTDRGVTALNGVGLCRCALSSLTTLDLTIKTIKQSFSGSAVSWQKWSCSRIGICQSLSCHGNPLGWGALQKNATSGLNCGLEGGRWKGFSCLRGWYSTARHSDLGIYPGGPFGTSEAKFNLNHQFVPRFAHWAVKHAEPAEFPCTPSLVDCPEQGTRWSQSPFSWAASRDREGSPFCWEVELFGSLTLPRAKETWDPNTAVSWNWCCWSHCTPLTTQAAYFLTEMFGKLNVLRIFSSQNNLKWRKERRNIPTWHRTVFEQEHFL